ncbi:retrovirus-related Pol polyprotein from transposon 297 [Trichonephila clavipes]|nr:retrovirus-related Pol polyprotein from transposon 297 [Trichonephila clavipes]
MTSETVEVARIALRLPPFWKSNVRLWIAQCDHAFTFSGISSDDTKYSALVANLDAETLSYVSDIVLSPPNTRDDEMPSHLLRKMKELSNGQLQDDFLQSLWLQRMPPHIQTVLSASSEPLDKLAIIADKPTLDSLARQIQELSLQVAELTRESAIPLATNDIVLTAGDYIHALGVSIEEVASATIIAVIKSRPANSGSEICVIPPSPTMNKSPQSNFSLFAANNTKIPAYGMVRKELNLGLRRPFIWTFIIADVSSPIIGADFLKHFNLLIDLKKKDLSNPSLISKSASHGTVHHIITTGPPVTARPRRLHPKLYDAVKVEFEFLLAQGIIRPSKSPWSSPLHVVPKSDSTVRPVGDYRQLNSVTEFDSYPMPYLNDFAHALHGKKIFSKIDIFKAFHQIPIAECDIPKTAPLPDKVQAVLDYKQPETVGSLRKFLGLLNFYRRFLPKAAEQQYLLSEFLKGSKGKKDSKPLNWSSEAIAAFQRCKQALADAALLAHPSPSAPLALHVDASDYAIGGSDNIAADVLSRVSAITFPSQIDYDCIAETQQTDQELHTLIASGTSLELKR